MNVAARHTGSGKQLLSSYLLSNRPGGIVLIGSQKFDIHWADGVELPPIHTFATLADYDSLGIATPTIAILQMNEPVSALNQTLGGAVRLFPDRLLVCVTNSASSDHTFFAFGFRRLDVLNSAENSCDARWFEYRLSSYKPSPLWLNAQFWANPERFDADDEHTVYSDDEDDDEDE